MGRKTDDNKVKAISYVYVDGVSVATNDLDEAQRRRLATELKINMLNAAFAGTAVFFADKRGQEEGGGKHEKADKEKGVHRAAVQPLRSADPLYPNAARDMDAGGAAAGGIFRGAARRAVSDGGRQDDTGAGDHGA